MTNNRIMSSAKNINHFWEDIPAGSGAYCVLSGFMQQVRAYPFIYMNIYQTYFTERASIT